MNFISNIFCKMSAGRLSTIAASLALLSAQSCTDPVDSPNKPDVPKQSTTAISFRSGTEGSRALPTDMANLQSIGLYGYYTGIERWYWASANVPDLKADYFCNVELKKSASWTYSPLRFWPIDPAKKLSFFAYSPYQATTDGSGNQLNLSAAAIVPYPAIDSQTGTPAIAYSVDEQITLQKDLLWAAQHDRTIESPSPVAFEMQHALSSLTFSMSFATQDEADKGYSVDLVKIVVSGVYGSGNLDLGYGSWSFDSSHTKDAQYVIEGANLGQTHIDTGDTDTKVCLSAAAGSLMLIPQSLKGVYVTFYLTFTDPYVPTTTSPVSFALGDYADNWEAGKAYNYEVLVRSEFITIHTSATAWSTGSAGTGTFEP